jgi:hypothetical protein
MFASISWKDLGLLALIGAPIYYWGLYALLRTESYHDMQRASSRRAYGKTLAGMLERLSGRGNILATRIVAVTIMAVYTIAVIAFLIREWLPAPVPR